MILRTPLASVGLVLLATAAVAAARPVVPPPADPPPKPEDRPSFEAPPKVRVGDGLKAKLFAMEPFVQDPVAICFDDAGRLYLAESFRQERGVEDNRSSPFWLLDDLQSQTVADRLRMFERHAARREGGMDYYTRYEDRVHRIEDTDGDLRADRETVFAPGFRDPLDGTGAGLIAREGDVWYTNIPHLWRLRDRDEDGVAEERTAVWSGFGVRVALRGHDMHGLTWGPDGKLYWSIGDRGYHVTLPDGRVLADPRSGAVFRCNADGSDIELFCTGLRNPQELAFDDFGNLFTGDNNSDAGDKARIVYCVEAGETGWSMDYQTLEGSNVRGPWNQEEIWAMRPDLAPDRVTEQSKVQPAWTIPPLAHVGSGPSGLVHYPGLGLSDRYRGAFFLCDFLGGDAYSRILAFRTEPVGAGFTVVDVHPFVENVLPTDVDFGYDGRMYMSDWGGGWYSKGYGEVYTVWDPERIDDPRIAEVGRLFREGFRGRDTGELIHLLGHADRRVRQRAQFALAEGGPRVVPLLADVVANDANRMSRIHAIWCLGQIAASAPWPAAAASLVERLSDVDAEVRAQAARVLGEAGVRAAVPRLIRTLTDDSARVRYHAAMALGRLGAKEAHPAIVSMLAENDGRDVFLRHAGVVALAWLGDRETTLRLAQEPQSELRLVAALVARRWRDPIIARFLQDPDERIVLEAARAINDLPISQAMPQLAALAERYGSLAAAETAPTVAELRRSIWRHDGSLTAAVLNDEGFFAGPPDETGPAGAVAQSPDRLTFEGAAKAGDRYVQRVTGLVIPPVSGVYVLAIASDDDSVLFLSPDEDPAKKARIAGVDQYVGRGDWQAQPGQRSAPIMLEAGKRYYVEARQFENGGEDFVSVAWEGPDGLVERPIGSGVQEPLRTPLLRRIINANLRLDDAAGAAALANLAAAEGIPESMRAEALAALAEWPKPGPRDRVIGAYRAIDPSRRDLEAYRTVLKQKLPGLVARGSPALRPAARELANVAGVTLDGSANFDVVVDPKQSEAERAACLRQLCRDGDGRADAAIERALASDAPLLRAEARSQLALRDPSRGIPALVEGLRAEARTERQAALVALGAIRSDAASAALEPTVTALERGELEPALQLDAIAAGSVSKESPLARRIDAWLAAQAGRGPLAQFDVALEGGDARRGDDVVHFHASATCLKCHAIAGTGGDAAPKLDGIGSRATRKQILQSLVDPNAVVAAGFGEHSAMPSMATVLTLEELRDVVEYLSTLK